MGRVLPWLFASLFALLTASVAEARVERFAVVVGNDEGMPGELPLRYAQTDAQRVHEVLLALGEFESLNSVLLVGSDAEKLRRTLISVNDRIRAALHQPDTEVMLFVYYSGHADAEALHLGASLLPMTELSQLVRGSAATFRMLVVDACQSGALTRRKGGRIAAPFPLPDEQIAGEGLAFLTASTADEDAQESDELRASFFTHALISGLLGAADRDHDGSVLLEEAYRYAYDSTLRSTSRTAFGIQHPTFSYELRGQGRLVLTRPGLVGSVRGTLELPSGAGYLILKENAEGAVVAEVGPDDPARRLSLAAGRYFLRGRTDDSLLEGAVQVKPSGRTRVDPGTLTRVAYSKLARKGGTHVRFAQAVEAGAHVRNALPSATRACAGGFLGYRLDHLHASFATRLGACTSAEENVALRMRGSEYDLTVRFSHVFDLGPLFSLELGLGGGVIYFTQHFETVGVAPTRRTLGGEAEVFTAVSIEAMAGLYATLEVAGQTYVLQMLDAETQRASLRPALAARGALAIGRRF